MDEAVIVIFHGVADGGSIGLHNSYAIEPVYEIHPSTTLPLQMNKIITTSIFNEICQMKSFHHVICLYEVLFFKC